MQLLHFPEEFEVLSQLTILLKLLYLSKVAHLTIFLFIPFATSLHFLLFSHKFKLYFDNYPSY